MSEGKRQNKIYLLTTISIYVGLVLVGGAPEILAGSELTQKLNGPSFEISTRSETIVSKAQFRKQSGDEKVVLHDFPGSRVFEFNSPLLSTRFGVCETERLGCGFENEKVLTTPLLPRASL